MRIWTVTNRGSSGYTVNISASTASPVWVAQYEDDNVHFTNHLQLVDEADEICLVLGGNGGTANSGHESWIWCPHPDFDFTPFLKKHPVPE